VAALEARGLRFHPSWLRVVDAAAGAPSFLALEKFVAEQRAAHAVFPAAPLVLNALLLTPLSEVKVVVLGQDPYHTPGAAHGLAFSVPRGVAVPPSLRNILTELKDDLGVPAGAHGSLESWARRGVLLLNTCLTVRSGEAFSHSKHGWEAFTDRLIAAVSTTQKDVAFVLWGKPAQAKRALISSAHGHLVIEAPHPSPLSAHRGFFGSKPFSKVNAFRAKKGLAEIDWSVE
jgi:uracil-DNA glycosylase